MNRPKFVSKVSKSPPHWGKNCVEVEVSPLFSRDAIHGQPKRYRVRTLVTRSCAPIRVGGGASKLGVGNTKVPKKYFRKLSEGFGTRLSAI